MNNWLRVPAGPPIDPGKHEVKYTGIMMVFKPTTKPRRSLDKIWAEIDRLKAPSNDAKIVT